MTIRKAQILDADDVVQLIYLAIKDIAYQLTGEDELDNVLLQLKSFYVEDGNRFSHHLIQVMELDQKVVGMILCYDGHEASKLYEPIWKHLHNIKQIPTPIIDTEADADEYYIDALAVAPAYQGKGIGKALFVAAEQFARQKQFSKIALNVDLLNERALALYTSLGYQADKQIIINNRPYWHMAKQL